MTVADKDSIWNSWWYAPITKSAETGVPSAHDRRLVIALGPGQCMGFRLELAVHARGPSGELDKPVALDKGLPVDFKSHGIVFDAVRHGETSLVSEIRRSSAKPSANAPRFRRTEPDVPRHQSHSDLR